MIIKCKICGGDIKFNTGDTFGQCDHCGCTSTIPKGDDEQKLNRFNRANHYRRQCEFDKAIAAYERILEEDDTDAEAHWGVVLSRYGIEYVEDPTTKKRIPTCHRVQVESILADADYLAAIENAPDTVSRDLYEEQAKEIAEIQKGILTISSQEKPYDVFICYKETDENGQRTRDSALAQEVYYGLTEQGYKVFFSRITLEDKLGQQYEPYIFAALNSAKVMVVIGTKPEHFNAVWVKNEWSRFLHLMKNDRKKLLIPCYRDMDPYDLPEELGNLQSQDMSKIGFIQDLLRGVRKVLDVSKEKAVPAQPAERKIIQDDSPDSLAPGVASLMVRTQLFMEDGDFKTASEYLDRILDLDPKCSDAYVAKACVAFGLRKEEDLAKLPFLFEDNADWQKAVRFANPQQKTKYEDYLSKVRERVNRQIRDYAYDCAMQMAVIPGTNRNVLDADLEAYKADCGHSIGTKVNGNRRLNSKQNEEAFRRAAQSNDPGNVNEQSLRTAAAMFEKIGDQEAIETAKICRTLAEQARQKAIYLNAMSKYSMERNRPTGLEETARVFLAVPEYKDAKAQAQKCMDEAEAIRNNLYSNAVREMEGAGEDSSKWDLAKKKLEDPELNHYRDTEDLRNKAAKRFDECLAAEEEARRQEEEKQRRAAAAAAAKLKRILIIGVAAVAAVIAAILLITKVIIPESNYQKAIKMREAGRYEEARDVFVQLGTYKDASEQVKATYYAEGIAKRDAKDWEGARAAFENAGDYSDATPQVQETKYSQAQAMYDQKDYDGAYAIYQQITGYKDVDNLLRTDDNLIAVAARAEKMRPYKTVGSAVTFGHYEQDNNTGNGPEEIEWIVLDVQDGKCLLISKYGLDDKPYNTEYTRVTWETCTLRTWLNGDFLQSAFSTEEKSAILITAVDNSSSQGYSGWSTSGGNNTQDQIFLLSYAEANKYFNMTYNDSNNTNARVAPTAYAIKNGAYTSSSNKTADSDAAGWWWLRSPGLRQHDASYVRYFGSLDYLDVDYGHVCVRPAFWLNLESGIF